MGDFAFKSIDWLGQLGDKHHTCPIHRGFSHHVLRCRMKKKAAVHLSFSQLHARDVTAVRVLRLLCLCTRFQALVAVLFKLGCSRVTALFSSSMCFVSKSTTGLELNPPPPMLYGRSMIHQGSVESISKAQPQIVNCDGHVDSAHVYVFGTTQYPKVYCHYHL